MGSCPDNNTLAAFIDGSLSDRAEIALSCHLRKCPECAETALVSIRLALPSGRSVDVDSDYGRRALVLTWSTAKAPRAADPAWQPPTQIDEYRLEELIGQGAMGHVYRGYDTRLDRHIAIKLIAELVPQSDACERFFVEAKALARLQHPNVVACYRAGELAGRPYLVSEYVRGISLDRLPKPVTIEQALAIGLDLARGLSAAHQRGVLHRDIKPANVMLSDTGQAKLVDFGLAKLTVPASVAFCEDSGGSATPTESGSLGSGKRQGGFAPLSGDYSSPSVCESATVAGTPAFMAPEIWQGAAATERSDIYSLGVLLYELCSGRVPFVGSSTAALRRSVLTEAVPSLLGEPRIASPLAAIVMRCLERDPNNRFVSAEAVLAALQTLSTSRLTEGSAHHLSVARGFIRSAIEPHWRRSARIRQVGGLAGVVLATFLLPRTDIPGTPAKALRRPAATVENAVSHVGVPQANHRTREPPMDAGLFPLESPRRQDVVSGESPAPTERVSAASPALGNQPYTSGSHPPGAASPDSEAQRAHIKARQHKPTLRKHRDRDIPQKRSPQSPPGHEVHQELEYEE